MHKKKSLKVSLILAVLCFAYQTSCIAYPKSPDTSPSKHDFFHTFSGSLSTEIALATKENKFGLVLFFGTQHCRFCHRMKGTVLNQETVKQTYQQHFKSFDIDIESAQMLTDEQNIKVSYKDYAKTHRIRLTPTIVFLNLQGESVYRQVGIIADPQEFIWLAEYVANGHTNKQSFAAFKMNKRRNSQP
ncbi:MAG: thioredoxin fold domain-containing protein [Porticoccaceae bacterium]|nr:thioredoxin fold domain-containing protein [Porticoccaceae bacterium]